MQWRHADCLGVILSFCINLMSLEAILTPQFFTLIQSVITWALYKHMRWKWHYIPLVLLLLKLERIKFIIIIFIAADLCKIIAISYGKKAGFMTDTLYYCCQEYFFVHGRSCQPWQYLSRYDKNVSSHETTKSHI